MKKALMMVSLAAVMLTAVNVQASADVQSNSETNSPACTNGFDSVDVCKLLS